MSLNPLYGQDTLPATTQAAIREFSDRYLAGIGASRPVGWADTLGGLVPSDSPMVTFPISQLRTLYKKTEGESRFKTLNEGSFDVKTQEFDDGYEARKYDLLRKAFAYRKWLETAGRFVTAEETHRHLQIALIMDGSGTRGGVVGSTNDPGGTSRLCVDGKNFFASDHPANMVDPKVASPITGATSWSNYQSSNKNILGSLANTSGAITGPFTTDYLQAEVTSMKTQVMDENGLVLGANPDTILVPLDYEESVINMLANNRLLASATANGGNELAVTALDNVYKGRFNVIGCKEFTTASGSTADWYLVDSKLAKEAEPWVSVRETVDQSLALRVFDESSDHFKQTGKIKVSSHIWYGFGLALPHAIRRVKGPSR